MSKETANIFVKKDKEKCVVSITVDTSEISSQLESEYSQLESELGIYPNIILKEDVVRACVNFAHIISRSCGGLIEHDAIGILNDLESTRESRKFSRKLAKEHELQLLPGSAGISRSTKGATPEDRLSRGQRRDLKRIREFFNYVKSEIRLVNQFVESNRHSSDREFFRSVFLGEIFHLLSELGFIQQDEARLNAMLRMLELQSSESKEDPEGSLSDKWR